MATPSFSSLEQRLLEIAAGALGRASAEGLKVAAPPSPEVGDVALGCHALAKEMKSDPQSLAQKIADAVARDALFHDVRAERGYVNVRYARAPLFSAVASDVAGAPRAFGRGSDVAPATWLIEYSGPNTNKPLHIGHLRNTILGAALSNVVRHHGQKVIRYNIVNDRGIHICKSMVAYRHFGAGATPQSTGEKGDHLVGRLYSLFASKAAEEFAEWAKGPGGEEMARFVATHRDSINAGADLALRKRFLAEVEKAGRALPFKPAKTKPDLFPEKMKADAALEAEYAAWLAARPTEVETARAADGLKRAQAAVARRFEAEVSKLHAETRDYLRRWEANDPEIRALWRQLNEWVLDGIEQTYKRLGVSFDHVDYESDVYLLGKEIVGKLLARGIASRKSDGTVVFEQPGKAPGEPPSEKVLLRADGTSVYITQDLGSLVRRFERHAPDRIVYVVGSEQELHFETLFAIVERYLPGVGARCVHLSYGMVELPHGKMKSREGEIVEADGFLDTVIEASAAQVRARSPELPEEEVRRRAEVIGLAAVKYNLLKFSKRSTVKFDVDEALDMNGRSGPYCLYALARIRSILRKLEAARVATRLDPAAEGGRMAPEEASLTLMVGAFPSAVAQAVADLEPYHVADYVFRLAKSFSAYYTATAPDGRTLFPVAQCPDEGVRALRISLLRMIETALENGLGLLGISTLEEM